MEISAFIQPAVAAFVGTLALVWSAALALRLSRSAVVGEWLWFAAFAALFGAAAFIGVFGREGIGGALGVLSLLLAVASNLALIEFGRRQFFYRGKTRLTPWLYLPLAGVAALLVAMRGVEGFELASRFVVALPAGALATTVLAQRGRASTRWEPALAAAAVAFLAVGYAFSVGPLLAFAAVGLLSAVWSESRRLLPLESDAGIFKKWQSPAAFLVLAIAGSTFLAIREHQLEQTAQFALHAADGAAGAGATETRETVAIDTRQLARDRASAQKTKQAVILLAIIVVVAGVWGGLAYRSNRRA